MGKNANNRAREKGEEEKRNRPFYLCNEIGSGKSDGESEDLLKGKGRGKEKLISCIAVGKREAPASFTYPTEKGSRPAEGRGWGRERKREKKTPLFLTRGRGARVVDVWRGRGGRFRSSTKKKKERGVSVIRKRRLYSLQG